jgi:hypothetical protein
LKSIERAKYDLIERRKMERMIKLRAIARRTLEENRFGKNPDLEDIMIKKGNDEIGAKRIVFLFQGRMPHDFNSTGQTSMKSNGLLVSKSSSVVLDIDLQWQERGISFCKLFSPFSEICYCRLWKVLYFYLL